MFLRQAVLLVAVAMLGFAPGPRAPSWKPQPVDLQPKRHLRGMAAINTLTAVAVGDNGVIVRTEDGGATAWKPVASNVTANLYGISFATSRRGWAVGAGNKILKTVDAGKTWQADSAQGTEDLRGVAMVSTPYGIRGVAVGDNGAIRLFNGLSWTATNLGPKPKLVAVAARPSSVAERWEAWAVGTPATTGGAAQGVIYHYFNGGWYEASLNPAPSALHGVFFLDENRGWAVGAGGVVLSTTNGETWFPNPALGSVSLNCIAFADANTGCVVGDGGAIFQTANGGQNWTPATSSSPHLRCVTHPSTAIPWTVGDDATVLRHE